jgi:hypothetical protein
MTQSVDLKKKFFDILTHGPIPAWNPITELIREHAANAIVFVAENIDKHHLSAYELYDLFMQHEITEDVAD